MRHIARLMLCATLLLPVGGCGIPGAPEIADHQSASTALGLHAFPEGLDLCADLYGPVLRWPAVDAFYGVHGEPDTVILQVGGELTCHAPRWEAASHLDLSHFVGPALSSERFTQEAPLQDLPPPEVTLNLASAGERDDSNPLPASPNPSDPVEDSNPLPARGGGVLTLPTASASESNPLPASFNSITKTQ